MWKFSIILSAFCALLSAQIIEANKICRTITTPAPIETPNSVDYTWLPAGPEGIVFRVRAANDAHIALTSSEGLSNPMIEVIIGGWANSKSAIRKNQARPDVFETPTPNILDANEFRGFWIRWSNNYITVGRENEAAPFMSYSNPDSYPINYVGIRTRRGASGSLIIEEP